jgi:hypothetical protein
MASAALVRSPLCSRAASFSRAAPSPSSFTPPAASPRLGAATPPWAASRAAGPGGAADTDAVVAAASLILSSPAAAAARPRAAQASSGGAAQQQQLPPLPPLPPSRRADLPPQQHQHQHQDQDQQRHGSSAVPADVELPDSSEEEEQESARPSAAAAQPSAVPKATCTGRQQPPPALSPVHLSPGAFESDWDAGELLGRGTFGDVRVATERATGRQAAVKVMPKSLRGRDRREDVLREVAFCELLQGAPGAVRLYGVYEVRRAGAGGGRGRRP